MLYHYNIFYICCYRMLRYSIHELSIYLSYIFLVLPKCLVIITSSPFINSILKRLIINIAIIKVIKTKMNIKWTKIKLFKSFLPKKYQKKLKASKADHNQITLINHFLYSLVFRIIFIHTLRFIHLLIYI